MKSLNAIIFSVILFSYSSVFADESQQVDHKAIMQAIHDSKATLDVQQNSFQKLARSVAGSRLYQFHSNYLNKAMVARVQKKGFATSSGLYHDVMVASNQGYSPKAYFADQKRGIIVMESVDHQWPKDRYSVEFFEKMTEPLKQMHQGASFQTTKLFPQWLEDAEAKLAEKQIPLPVLNPEYFQKYQLIKEKLKANLSRFEGDIKPTHHDINPGNILFDSKRAYLIDFETASQDIFYLDVAEAYNFFIYDESKEDAFLKAYFKNDPNQEQKAKFVLFKSLAFLKNGLWLASISGKTELPKDTNILDYPDFEARIRKGLVDFSNAQEVQNLAISEFREGIRLLETEQCQKAIAFLFGEI